MELIPSNHLPGPITFIDCLVFCVLVARRLFQDVGLFLILLTLFDATSFFFFELPIHLYRVYKVRNGFGSEGGVDHFSRTASLFEVLVVRCMRYAFAQLPNQVIKTFFHKDVALAFMRHRYRVHRASAGQLEGKIWEEVDEAGVRGVWFKRDPDREPDFVLYYIHGGGYVYGSVWFYLEWLHAFHTSLCLDFGNPAIFALSYSAAPHSTYPAQINEANNGYAYIRKFLPFGSHGINICIAGDSAGAALAMMVVHGLLRTKASNFAPQNLPSQVLLISPWLSLNPSLAAVTDSDFVTMTGLRACAKAYAPSSDGHSINEDASVMRKLSHDWPDRFDVLGEQPQQQSPVSGPASRPVFHIWYGTNETLHNEIAAACKALRQKGWTVQTIVEGAPDKAIHVWPVAAFYLSRKQGRRLESVRMLSSLLYRGYNDLPAQESRDGCGSGEDGSI